MEEQSPFWNRYCEREIFSREALTFVQQFIHCKS